MRKPLGTFLLIAWMIGYIAVAAVIGDRVTKEAMIWQLIYFPVVGVAWVLPLRPLLKWMHAKDAPLEKPDV